ncbi:hypothetical protein L207DRAFT_573054 [Hyaloscypha variabilis F]|uniref:Ubiquitin 3 binding protein But2 C-terminal domain-containing protein n=1 Tax=Hyaloscypha variabilis (strain UAMH 11265 / GT02V1 / F) TaxID=1149755 RepID=A0A2J6QXD3_HYAVF|nr:hypothetical protein L207DRAFT_573054 [Hyaloscypha variabilis F]
MGCPSTQLVDSFGLEAPLQATAQLWFLTARLSPRTVIADDFGGLAVEVPSGQEIYVNANGALGFTQAHLEIIPSDAYPGSFFNLTIISDCTAPRTVINWKGADGSTGVFACPTIPASGNTPVSYQVFLKTPAFNLTNCVTLGGFTATYLPDFTIGAWQYM